MPEYFYLSHARGWVCALLLTLYINAGYAQYSDRTPLPVERMPKKRSIPDRHLLYKKPGNIREDYMQPRFLTQQTFTWKKGASEWRVLFPPDEYAEAGFVFKKRLDLTAYTNSGYLFMTLDPNPVATNLAIGVVSQNPTNDTRVQLILPLDFYSNKRRGGEAQFNIPLADVTAQYPVSETSAAFDWRYVREFQLLIRQPLPAFQLITIKHLQFIRDQHLKYSKY